MPHFDFVPVASPAAEARNQLSGHAYWVNDQVYVAAFGAALDVGSADLVTVALSCYAADRLARRPRGWSRELQLRIAVARPDLWIAAIPALSIYLHELTDDAWTLEFVGGRAPRVSEGQGTLFPIDRDSNGSVALFSGGLDSLAGATAHLAADPDRLILLGSRSSTVIGRDQRLLAGNLRHRYGDRVVDLGVPLRLRRAQSAEDSQRTRGFLFLSLATAAASMSGSRRVIVFENGYGAHNPRLGEQQWGAQATRSTHPYSLALFEAFSQAIDMPVSVELPHRYRTKAELLGLMPRLDHDLVALTASCDAYPLRVAGVTHCGGCGSCVLRRQSLIAAGLAHLDRADYQRRPLERMTDVGPISVLMARQAWLMGRLARLEVWSDISTNWPTLTLGLDDLPWHERTPILRLMSAVSDEWNSMLEAAPRLVAPLAWPSTRQAATA
jgi:7-cyano-7-deazaguanine synthase in queuosine biosynthesis